MDQELSPKPWRIRVDYVKIWSIQAGAKTNLHHNKLPVGRIPLRHIHEVQQMNHSWLLKSSSEHFI
jgi:hypothetical protein